jgi:hypothetical protein
MSISDWLGRVIERLASEASPAPEPEPEKPIKPEIKDKARPKKYAPIEAAVARKLEDLLCYEIPEHR